MKRIACLSLFLLAAPAAVANDLFDHNGSVMVVDYASGTIAYRVVKPSIAKTIAPGAIVFAGTIEKGKFAQGTAYTFRRGCPAAPYAVSGRYDASLPGFVLAGPAPHRGKTGCEVIGYEIDNPNARLVFIDMAARKGEAVTTAEDQTANGTTKTGGANTAPKPLVPTATP
ncbi:hypothetical protein SAMN05880582_1039 [Rhizobium sp. RU20A]|uniref:hypothetical protein n=1 Tax=Rhizobium sp. RU20A TaxID=1907412 RepID=UPI0009560BB2|nr:hypothetical protein [Rhizobium sp. RU20A]SIQ68225.1 hypothetical protein SAMN05880582_1039 [Rhizobium sp. RU20A]